MNKLTAYVLVIIVIVLIIITLRRRKKSKYFTFLKKSINCKNVFLRMKNRKPAKIWPPPKTPPQELLNKFTQSGEMPIKRIYYRAERYAGSLAATSNWSESMINKLIDLHKNNKKMGNYNLLEEQLIDYAITKYSVKGKNVAVIGSTYPWVEAIIASKNPQSITTIEYGKIYSSVKYINTFTPSEFATNTLQHDIKFDFVISHSSLEHSGLGRYGDELNPDGDIEAAEEVWCMLRKGGYFLIGLPFANKSFIRWNADRNYGPERMKYFAANFQQIEFIGTPWAHQNPLLLKKN